MQVSDFDYTLPPELIAKWPVPERTDSRLLVLERDRFEDRTFADFPEDCLMPGDLLVLNNTQVIPARLFAQRATGGQAEVFVERLEDEHRFLARVRPGNRVRAGDELDFGDGVSGRCLEREGEFHRIEFPGHPVNEVLERHGETPLPPYLGRDAEPEDRKRYQTVYAKRAGAVAAPTAGLHFTRKMLKEIEAGGVEIGYLTLHVGSGTYQPMRDEDPERHEMHSEEVEVPSSLCVQLASARARSGRVVAVGTTCVRALEAAGQETAKTWSQSFPPALPWSGATDLFIRPGFEFRCVDALLTNFHQPRSTLMLLVAAFAGRERILDAYRHAVEQRYRFLSYGDAMFIPRRAPSGA